MRGIRAFWEKWGYVCVLSACAGLIAMTAVLTHPVMPEPTPPEVTRYAQPTPSVRPVDAAVQPTPAPPTFLAPCEGELGMTFSTAATVYNETLGEYAAHEGVDILTDEGAAVRAMEDGLVTRVWQDALLGNCVEVTHRSGYISTYASLYSAGVVQEGEPVSRGQIVGTAGASALTECAAGPHVHIELRRTRKLLDPMNYLEEIS